MRAPLVSNMAVKLTVLDTIALARQPERIS